jgi:CheY-like chemotaxis protein
MSDYHGTTGYGPTEPADSDLASASATERRAPLRSVVRLEHVGNSAADPDAGPLPPLPSQPRAGQNHRGQAPQVTVLVVDDAAPVRETLAEALSIPGYSVITAASVEEAETAMQRLGAEAIQLVIADIHLTPGSQTRAGYVLAQSWHAQHPELPVILISGDPRNQDLPEIRAGAWRFLLKPFALDVLLATVQEALRG